jgi:hypothetical protein
LELSESEEVWTKRAALSSLGAIARQPGKVVPRLIRAFDDFEDPDPDSYDNGDHEIVTNGLAAFGEAAEGALPALRARLVRGVGGFYDEKGNYTETLDWDKGVLQAIRKIGPAAIAVLAELEAHWHGTDEELVANDWNPLAVTILHLRKSRETTGAEL